MKGYFFNSQENKLAQFFKKKHIDSKKGKKNIVLIQCAEDLCSFALFGQIVSSLRNEKDIWVEQYVLRSLRVGEFGRPFSLLFSRFCINPWHIFKWTGLYSSFCNGVGYSSTSFQPINDLLDAYFAWNFWKNIPCKKTLITMKVEGIIVGDLINDSYLRFKPAPTVDLKDKYLFVIVWQAYRDVRRAKKYFSSKKPSLYLTSYSTYIQHGIPVRVALDYDIKVFSFGNYQEFTKELTRDDWVHTKNSDYYASAFEKEEHQDEKIQEAEDALNIRLSGGVDAATSYMKKSAYLKISTSLPNMEGAVVIFLHDFYDSPHVYRDMLFPDFWEWICFTIKVLQRTSIRFFLKPHPNQVDLSDGALTQLKECYPDLNILSSGTSNKQLVDSGICCAVTVYGSVAHEMAYFGVPTIACAHHPHISFNFCKTARSLSEYDALLKKATKIQANKNIRLESLIFYYMHNLNLCKKDQRLNAAMIVLRKICNDKHLTVNVFMEELNTIKDLAMYKNYIKKFTEKMI